MLLMVDKGLPYRKGDVLVIEKSPTTIGRFNIGEGPDISFSSPFISRMHAVIANINNRFVIEDNGSTNGTYLNGVELTAQNPVVLHSDDVIVLSDNEVVLRVCFDVEIETRKQKTKKPQSDQLDFIEDKRKIIVDGKEVGVTGRVYLLFKFLFDNQGLVKTHDDIRKYVWPERSVDENGIPFVGEEEIAMLVMRLRKKLGRQRDCILNIRGHGYMMEELCDGKEN